MYPAEEPGPVVAPLSEVPQQGSSIFSLFSLIKLHLASYPLASSYSRVTVSSVFCADLFFGPSVLGSVNTIGEPNKMSRRYFILTPCVPT